MTVVTETAEGTERLIRVDHLHPNPDNPRLEAGDVTELANSIRKLGLLQALLVRPAPEFTPCQLCFDPGEPCPGHFWIEAGYRRWVAMKTWNNAIRCHVQPHALPREEALERNLMVGLIENLHRENLDPIEKARSFGRLRDECHLSQAEIARSGGFHPSTVATSLALLELAPGAQEKVRNGQLGVGEALKIVRRHRRKQRAARTGGSGRAGAVWEPDHFTRSHALSVKAEAMCDVRGHTSRRRRGGACDLCWEDTIRADQRLIDQLEFQQLTQDVLCPPPSWPPETPAPRAAGSNGQQRPH